MEAKVDAPLDVVWRAFNEPCEILRWDRSDAWRTMRASNDLRVGGRLILHVVASDGGSAFDFSATYTRIEAGRLIEWRSDDGREVCVAFHPSGKGIILRQTFDADPTLSEEEQRADWQGVLDRFARYCAGRMRGA